MSGECFEHDLQWYSGGIECPVCTLTSERDRLWEVKKLAREVNSLLDSTMSWMDEEGIQVPFIMSVMIGSLGEKSRELAAALKAKG